MENVLRIFRLTGSSSAISQVVASLSKYLLLLFIVGKRATRVAAQVTGQTSRDKCHQRFP